MSEVRSDKNTLHLKGQSSGPAGGATPKQTGGSNGQEHQTPVSSPMGHNRRRGVKDLGHGMSF